MKYTDESVSSVILIQLLQNERDSEKEKEGKRESEELDDGA